MSFTRGEPVSLNELKFISSAICEKQLRMDGRGVYDFRTLKISFGAEYGQVQVQLGTTRVYVVTTCEVTAPKSDKPSDGFFTFNVHFSPISSLEYESGRCVTTTIPFTTQG
jgi:exosome complex component RRP45